MKKKKIPPQVVIEDEEYEGEDDPSALEIRIKCRANHQRSAISIVQDFSQLPAPEPSRPFTQEPSFGPIAQGFSPSPARPDA